MFKVNVTGQNPADAKTQVASKIGAMTLGPIESQLAPKCQDLINTACDAMTGAGVTAPVSVKINSITVGSNVNIAVDIDTWGDFTAA